MNLDKYKNNVVSNAADREIEGRRLFELFKSDLPEAIGWDHLPVKIQVELVNAACLGCNYLYQLKTAYNNALGLNGLVKAIEDELGNRFSEGYDHAMYVERWPLR